MRARTSGSETPKRRPAARGSGRAPGRPRVDRAVLVDAAIDTLSAAGPRGLTSVRVARAAGLAQSGFYRYFRNPDDCLRVVADAVGDRLRALHSELWRTMLAADPADVDATTRYYEAWLGAVLVERRAASLFFRHRNDPSPFGRAMTRHLDLMRADMTEWLAKIAASAGVAPGHERSIALLAELLLAEALGLCESLLEERRTDVAPVARALARSAVDATKALVGSLLRAPARSPLAKARSRRRAVAEEPPAAARERLLAAAVNVLRRDGPGGLTTVSVTREAGIVQSGFYRHFKDVADCERAAAQRVAVEFRRVNRERRQRLLTANPTDRARTAVYYEDLLTTALGADRHFSELYLQYRRESSPLGKVARDFERAARKDIVAWLTDLGARFGLDAADGDRIEIQAELLWAGAFGLCEALLSGRVSDSTATARLLADHAVVQSARGFKRPVQ